MSGPWEKYAKQASQKPWEKYASMQAQSRVDGAFDAAKPAPETINQNDFEIEGAASQLADQLEKNHGEYGAGDLMKANFAFGLTDEVAGVAGALGGVFTGEAGKEYDIARRAEQIMLERARERSGVTGQAAQIAGGLFSGAGATRAAQGVTTALGRVAQGMKEGAIVGGLQGFGQSDGGVGERAKDAIIGAGIGGAAGGVIGTAFEGTRAVAQGGGKLIQAGKSALRGPEQKAISRVANAIADDGLTPNRLIARTADGMVPADAAVQGGNVQGLARAAQAVPGKGRTIAEQTLRTRDIQSAERVKELVGNKLGVSESLDDALQTLLTKRSSDAQKAFKNAWDTPYTISPRIDDVINRIPESALADAKRIAALEGRPFMQQTMAKVGKEGAEEFTQTLSLEELHYVQQALRDQADTAYRAGSGALGTKIKDLHKDLTGMMKRGSPAYRKAMFRYADQSAVVDAMQRGSDFFKKGMKRLTPNEVRKMSLQEREAARVGVMNAVVQRLDDAATSRDPFKLLFGRPGDMKLVKAFFDDHKQWRKFQMEIIREGRMRQTSQFVRGGSPTQRIAEEVKGASDAADTLGEIVTGNVTHPIFKRIMQRLSGQELAPEVAEEISNILMRTNSTGMLKVNAAIAKLEKSNKSIAELGSSLLPIVRGITQGVAATGGIAVATN